MKMILNLFFVSIGGIGHALILDETGGEERASKSEDMLTSGFFTAIRAFGREIYQELQFIQFVRSRVVFLPSQELYVLSIHATNTHSAEDLLYFLEDIRDEINTNFWEDIHKPNFFCDAQNIRQKIQPIVNTAIEKRSWETV
jgi:hypothetical protein